tara:strand:+ start:770 stop:1420 length:651 start_codon:yes stop_codon:yes gene_type:complete
MFTNLSRSEVQFISFAMFTSGAAILIAGGWNDDLGRSVGITLMAGSIWFMMMCEASLLTKVQNEMYTSLEKHRAKQERETEELLIYLKQSKLNSTPFKNHESADRFIKSIQLPAAVVDPGGAVLSVNAPLTESLGYGEEDIGQLCFAWHKPEPYGEYIQGIQQLLVEGKRFMYSRLSMIDKTGKENVGTVAIIFLDDMRSTVSIWLPDDRCILKSV